MVVNYEDPYQQISDNVIISLKNSKKATVIQKGVSKSVKVTDGTITLQLEPGEGCMVIPD